MKKQLLLSFFALFFGTLLTFAQTSPVCGGTFTDPEGATTNYADNSDYTVTINPNNPGDFVTVTFTSFETEANYDGLYIYNGNSISAPQISSANPAGNIPGGLPGAFWGTNSPGSITSSSSDGSLTFRFRSDSDNNLPGWIANVACGPMTTCLPPTSIITSTVTSNTVTLAWTANSSAAQWEVIVQPSSVASPTSTSTGVLTTTNPFTASGLLPATSYKAYVRTICSATGSTNWTSSSIFTTPTCSVPTLVTINSTSTTSVAVSWTANNAVTQWEVIVQPSSMTAPTATSTGVLTNTNSYVASGLTSGTTYKAFVRTICSTTSISNWALSSIFTTSTCSIPTSISTNGISPTSATLTWAVGSATQWEVLVLLANETPPITTSVGILVNQNTYTASGLITGIPYKFYIRTICGVSAKSSWTTGYAFTPYISLPPLVTNTTTYTNQQLVTNVLVNNPCITISNVTSSTGTNFGSTNGIGYFTNTNPTFPLSSGIVLSTGNANNVPGPNTSILSDGITTWTGDSQLENIILAATGAAMNSKNATKLEFDFTSLNEFMSFNFLFASDEYGTYQCEFADAFAFLLTDLVSGVTTNLAVVPGTTAPISVVTIRDALFNNSCTSVNPDFFDTYFSGATNYSSATNFNGQTAEMTASSAIIPNHPYHIKLVVADRSDTAFDSAVFIKAGSFTTGPPECTDKINLIAFVDANNNGIKDSGEVNFTYGSFVSQQNNTGPISNFSSPFGKHTVYYSNPINTYDFSYSLNSEYAPYYSAGTTNYNDVSIALGSGTQTLYFPITLVSGYNDVAVSIVSVSPPRPGFNYTNKIIYRNLGVATTSGQVSFTKDANVAITSVSQPGIVSNPTGFTYDFANLTPYETRSINVTMSIPVIPIVNINDVLINNATVSAPSADINISNNAFSNSQIVVASYDPNDKMESHGNEIQFNQFAASDYLYYTIRFQNEGTANAISVKIEDLLDSKFDETSIQMISASHGYIMERINNQIIWKFDYINLPPALSNEELSKGYVCFKIKLKPGFAIGDIIPNTANIYFDTNPAIVTNTFNTQFVSLLGNLVFETSNYLLVPNPASNFVQVYLQNNSESIKSIVIYDILGKKVKEVNEVNSKEVQINTSDLSKGLYLVEITSDSFIKQIKKLVIN
jgi:hypothetical protein